MTDLQPVFAPLDTSVEQAVDAMTVLYLTELAQETAASGDADPEDETAPDLPSVDLEEFRDWLVRACSPQEFVSPCHGRLVAAAISRKLTDLSLAQATLDAFIEAFLAGAEFRISMDSLVVNHPIVMDVLGSRGLHQNSVMLIPMEDMYEPDVDEDVPQNLRDILVAVTRWHGFYLSRAVLVDFSQLAHRFSAAAADAREALGNKKLSNVVYYQRLLH